MSKLPEAPKIFQEFSARYPKLAKAWSMVAEGEAEGPLDQKTARLIKLPNFPGHDDGAIGRYAQAFARALGA